MFKKTLSLFTASLLLSAVASQAQDHLYQGVNFSYPMVWDDERFVNNDDETSGMAGFNLGYEFAEQYALELSANTTLGDPDGELYALNFFNFMGDREGYTEGWSKSWTPYWLAGISYTDMDDAVLRVTEAFSGQLGVGASKFISDRMEFRADARAYKAFATNGNIGNAEDTLVDWGINFSLNYHFGSQKSAPAPVAAPAPTPAPAPAPAPEPVTRTVEVELTVNFNTDSDSVIEYGPELAQIVTAMKTYTNLDLTLEGHTDSRGEAAYNKDLSQRRADTVKAKIVEEGIAASRITAIGYGEERPIADNMYRDGRAKNRRVVGKLSWEEVVD